VACGVVPRALSLPGTAGYGVVMEPTISRSVDVAADPSTVWSMITDLPRMGEFSPENVGGHWLDGVTTPVVGSRFRGTNRNEARGKLWWTRVRVVECEPERRFTFDVRTPFGVRVSRWSYRLTPTGDGCRLTEHWYRVGSPFVQRVLGPRVTGQADRPGFNIVSIEHTLAAVKAAAERTAARR
jgi:uncharacterized protein YndB with AHSA1/START domain